MKKILKALAFGLVSWASLIFFLQVQLGNPITVDMSLRYLLVAAIIAGYTWILDYFNLKYAWHTYLLFFLAATAYLGFNMGPNQEAFRDLGTILMWMILNGLGVLLGLLYELIMAIIKHNASTQ